MELLFYWTLLGLWFTVRLLFRCMAYMPLIYIGYLVSTHILSKKDNGFGWLVLTIVLACLFYLLIFFLKGMMLCLKKMNVWIWIPLFFLCIAFTCIMPVWMVHGILNRVIENKTVVWILSVAFGYYVYLKYQFSFDQAPSPAAPFYRAGIELTVALCKNKKLKAKNKGL
jgi:hypothetical protein